jgi:two-component system nitrogen regulation response regulator GlnG
MPNVLIADDEESIRTVLARVVERLGIVPIIADNGSEALEMLKTREIEAAFVDIRMPGPTGLDILDAAPSFAKRTSVIVMTAQDTMENAVAAMKRGAFDYVTKPFDLEEVAIILGRALENQRLRGEIARLKKERPAADETALVGSSRAMQDVFKTVGKIADQDVTVLIHGESGTGKELVARALHSSGRRGEAPFIAVNCSAIPENLMESEFFGHKKGAFTGADADKPGHFERAHGGTVFLDEVGDMPPSLQAKLLRFLQDKTAQRLGDGVERALDVRVIAATNRDLREDVRIGRFREDLFFRLNVVPITLPPLKHRREDIRALADFFTAKYAPLLDAGEKILAPEALEFLEYRDWPGNVRELENAVKRLIVLSRSAVVSGEEASAILAGETQPLNESLEGVLSVRIKSMLSSAAGESQAGLYERLLPEFERPLIRAVLEKTGGNQVRAAEILGINRNTLRKKILDLGIG